MSELGSITVEELRRRLETRQPICLVDVRELHEWRAGTIAGAIHVPRSSLPDLPTRIPDRSAQVVLFCASGKRSAFGAVTLRQLGYTHVETLQSGFERWKQLGLPFESASELSLEQQERYARHLALKEIGEEGQRKLLSSKVLIVGAGGLGSPAALYLAAAGVGTLGVVDADVVDRSNLQRQILHATSRIGLAKVRSAASALRDQNPDVRVIEVQERLTRTNAERVLAGYDVLVDGCDNFPTRYLLSDAGVLGKIPVVHGSIFRFEGQVTVFDPGLGGPCYRCLYPEPPPPELAPSCAEAGVLGVLPGVIGTLQATETIKLLLGRGQPLVGRLLSYDAWSMRFAELLVRRDPACPACGDTPSITSL